MPRDIVACSVISARKTYALCVIRFSRMPLLLLFIIILWRTPRQAVVMRVTLAARHVYAMRDATPGAARATRRYATLRCQDALLFRFSRRVII